MVETSAYRQFKPLEWNASGALHCYGKTQKRAFVVEVFLTGDVDGAILQAAVDKALERMPYYRWALVRRKGLFYFAENDLPFEVVESEKPRRIGGATTNYHNIDVTYSGSKIDFSMNHGFCDGLGLNRFIEAVLYHFFCAKDGKAYDAEGICTDAVPFDGAETFDAFLEKFDVDREKAKQLASKEGSFRLPEFSAKGALGPVMYRKPLRIAEGELMAWCKANASSPAAAISAIMAKAIVRVNGLSEGKVRSVAPFSLRRSLHAEKTFTNCSAAVFMPMEVQDINTLSMGELAAKMRTRLKEQMTDELGQILSSGINMITHLGKSVPTFFLKNQVMSLADSRQDTFFVDYVGGLRTNGYADQIAEVRYLSSAHGQGTMNIVLSATAGFFYVNFLQTFESDAYYRAFCEILGEEGIAFDQLESDSYLNPKVEFGKEQR